MKSWDQWVIVGDRPLGPKFSLAMLKFFKDERVNYMCAPRSSFPWGNLPRDIGLSKASRSHIICVDDDDELRNLEEVRSRVEQNKTKVNIFAMKNFDPNMLYHHDASNHTGHCCVYPNDKRYLPSWTELVNSGPYIEQAIKNFGGAVEHNDVVLNAMHAGSKDLI